MALIKVDNGMITRMNSENIEIKASNATITSEIMKLVPAAANSHRSRNSRGRRYEIFLFAKKISQFWATNLSNKQEFFR